jgi:hypothetical protein
MPSTQMWEALHVNLNVSRTQTSFIQSHAEAMLKQSIYFSRLLNHIVKSLKEA